MTKTCAKCNKEYKGWGDTCAECRKAASGLPSGMPQSTMSQAGGGNDPNICSVCGKRVYVMEKVEVSGLVMHSTCFRCHKCNNKLSTGKFSKTPDGHFYCPTHFKELFRLKGKYTTDCSELNRLTSGVDGGNAVSPTADQGQTLGTVPEGDAASTEAAIAGSKGAPPQETRIASVIPQIESGESEHHDEDVAVEQ